MADVEVECLANFVHGKVRGRRGHTAVFSEHDAKSLARAGLVRLTGADLSKKPQPLLLPDGPAAPSFVLPPAPASQTETSNTSADGEKPRRLLRKNQGESLL